MKKILTITLIVTLLINGCKKEIQTNSNLTNSSSISSPGKPLISNAAIAAWFAKNPVGPYLTPDWTKARQAKVGGVSVVTVPILTISKPATQQTTTKQTNSISTNETTTTLNNFDVNHPPALYFFQSTHGSSVDSVKALLMNFVPDDPNSENGKDNIWTGKLMEWSLQSDTVLYQVLVKSKVTSRLIVNCRTTSQGSNATPVHVNSIFSDIWDALKTFVEAIGYFFGVPGDYNYYAPGVTLGWCDFLWGVFCDGGGDGSGGGGDSGGVYYDQVYDSYIPGYNGSYDSSGTWTSYSGGSGGNTSPCPTLAPASIGGKSVLQLQGCPIGIIQVPPPVVFNVTATSVINNIYTNCVYSNLQNNTVYQGLIHGFLDTKTYNLTLQVGSVQGYSATGITYPDPNNNKNIITIFDQNQVSTLSIGVLAETFLHEAYHAYIDLVLAQTTPVGQSAFNLTYANSFDQIVASRVASTKVSYAVQGLPINDQQIQHDVIAQDIVNLAFGLQQFIETIYPAVKSDPLYTPTLYQNMIWSGLKDSQAFATTWGAPSTWGTDSAGNPRQLPPDVNTALGLIQQIPSPCNAQ